MTVPATIEHVLICGLGSIGRRHLRHLRALGIPKISAYRTGLAQLSDAGQPAPDEVFTDLNDALRHEPDVVIVANPTALHVETATKAVEAGCHVLIEKPLSHALSDCESLIGTCTDQKVTCAVAYNMRFHPLLRKLRTWIESEEPFGYALMCRAQVSAWLPAWHPWEDYHTSYAAKRELGGGAALTNSHELDLVLWLLGPASTYFGVCLGRNPLGTDVDEAAAFVIRHNCGALSTINLSFVERPQRRTLEVSFQKATVVVDLMNAEMQIMHANAPSETVHAGKGFAFDQVYSAQLKDFFNGIDIGTSDCATLQEATEVVRIATSAFESE